MEVFWPWHPLRERYRLAMQQTLRVRASQNRSDRGVGFILNGCRKHLENYTLMAAGRLVLLGHGLRLIFWVICWRKHFVYRLVGQVTCRGCTITKLPKLSSPMSLFQPVINFQMACWSSLRQFSVQMDRSAAIAGLPVDFCSCVKTRTRSWTLRTCSELHMTTQWVARPCLSLC